MRLHNHRCGSHGCNPQFSWWTPMSGSSSGAIGLCHSAILQEKSNELPCIKFFDGMIAFNQGDISKSRLQRWRLYKTLLTAEVVLATAVITAYPKFKAALTKILGHRPPGVQIQETLRLDLTETSQQQYRLQQHLH